jgi:hypothetical protein
VVLPWAVVSPDNLASLPVGRDKRKKRMLKLCPSY